MIETFSPAISVIVPVYNAEKYLPVCLESILNQTFTDFELLVVDDCSTDSSATIAESYLERFGGRLKIISLPENTGSCAVPRNVGLDLSRGKYVYFADADDFLLDNALEILCDYAETFQAEVVYTERGFNCVEEIFSQALVESFWNPPKFASEQPIFEPENISERVEKYLKLAFGMPPWEKFFRRDFLVDNDIKFPAMRISEDLVWTFKIICAAKKILRVPTPLYVHRTNKISMTGRKRTPQDEIKFWLNPMINGIDCLDEFMNGFDLFNRADDLRLRVLNFFAKIQLDFMAGAFKSLEPREVYKIFSEEISKSNGDHSALIAWLLFIANVYRNELKK
ncbi:MAG: glycosyltransferase [Selenomonadaceae bacterium]|nr:glycosyltransferase [Selenomonadaceae bacterium]